MNLPDDRIHCYSAANKGGSTISRDEAGSKVTPSGLDAEVPEAIAAHPAWGRLQDQISWYDRKSVRCQKWYKGIKLLQIVLAVGIPVTSHLGGDLGKWVTSVAGALIAIFEGLLHMNQYSTLWVTYRSTAERLKHEKYLFLSAAGPYRDFPEAARLVLLAERVEEHVSSEHANWFDETRRVITTKREGAK